MTYCFGEICNILIDVKIIPVFIKKTEANSLIPLYLCNK